MEADEAKEKVAALREKRDEEADELEAEGYDPDAYGPAFEVPDVETEDAEDSWFGWIPPEEEGGKPVYIEGVLPSTTLTRQAMEAVPKRARRDPLIGLKESQENLLRICIRQIGDDSVNFAKLRGKGLDRFLSAKQMHYVTEFFERLTTPEEADVEDFLSTVQTGKKRKK